MDPTPEQQFMIDFNLHWVPAALGLDVSPATASIMLGITEEQFRSYAEKARENVRMTALDLLADPDLASAVDRLPVPAKGAVMTIGDSITTCRYGYAEILREMLAMRGRNDVRFLNVAQSGYTSNHGVENTYTQFLAKQPDLVFVKFGTNDCKMFGSPVGRRLVSVGEYRQNIAAIVEAFQSHTKARVALLSPLPVIEEAANHFPPFAPMRMTWKNEDLFACAEVILSIARERGIRAVDLAGAFGPCPSPSLYLTDGIHPSPEGHRLILQTVLRADLF